MKQLAQNRLTRAALLLTFLTGCGSVVPEVLEETESKVVYGNDDRLDVYSFAAGSEWKQRALTSTVALMRPGEVSFDSNGTAQFNGGTLGSNRYLCSDQSFRNQPASAFCSGTLIADDLILTAGHCIDDSSDCANTLFVFKYAMRDDASLEVITRDDVFSCTGIVRRELGTTADGNLDYAVVRIDRKATPRFTPAPVVTEPVVNEGDQVTVIGCPSGIPFKIDEGGAVRDARASVGDDFVANSDTFGGNSGSGVYDASGRVVGILVRGENDYTSTGSCYAVNRCSETGCRGEDITYVSHAVEATCIEAPDSSLCADLPPPPPPADATLEVTVYADSWQDGRMASAPYAGVGVYLGDWHAGNQLGVTGTDGTLTVSAPSGERQYSAFIMTSSHSAASAFSSFDLQAGQVNRRDIHIAPVHGTIRAHFDVGYGNALYITGASEYLGNWSAARKMTWGPEHGVWIFSGNLPVGLPFKIVKAPWTSDEGIPTAGVTWEEGENRVVAAPNGYVEFRMDVYPSFPAGR
ncbi:MAG: trypsin-like peptidase domain-containing protein [Myxococcaceae bacterium]